MEEKDKEVSEGNNDEYDFFYRNNDGKNVEESGFNLGIDNDADILANGKQEIENPFLSELNKIKKMKQEEEEKLAKLLGKPSDENKKPEKGSVKEEVQINNVINSIQSMELNNVSSNLIKRMENVRINENFMVNEEVVNEGLKEYNQMSQRNQRIREENERLKKKKLTNEEMERKRRELTENGKKCTFELSIRDNEDRYVYDVFVSSAKHASEFAKQISFEKTEVSENVYKQIKNYSSSIGMIMMLEKGKYTDNPLQNEAIHIPHVDDEVPIYPKMLYVMLKDFYPSSDIHQIIVGHEHGDEMHCCHLQICIKFNKKISYTLNPGRFDITHEGESWSLLFMQQAGRNNHALENYCRKEKRFSKLYYFDSEEKSSQYSSGWDEVWARRDELTYEEARDIIAERHTEKFMMSFSNIDKALKRILKPSLPEFQWVYPPEYALNTLIPGPGGVLQPFRNVFIPWFKAYCIDAPEGQYRRKALCLYSSERAMGKSYMVRRLVNHPDYYLEYNNTFVERNEKPYAKLLILDDMKMMTKQNIQTWLSLVASEKTSLRDAFVNSNYEMSLPCIITTNNDDMVGEFLYNELFNTQVTVVEILSPLMSEKDVRKDLKTKDHFVSGQLAALTRIKYDKRKADEVARKNYEFANKYLV